jgi:thiamine biosynthesis lipoprotein
MTSHHSIPLMAGSVNITLYDIEGTLAEELILAAQEEGLRLQRIFNFYDPASELSRLNRERTMRASPTLRGVIALALRYAEITDGKYDITLGRQFLARKRGLPLPRVLCSYKDIIIEKDTITLAHPDAMVDLGSVAKGYIADRLLGFLQHRGVESAFIDARGDMRIAGTHLEVIEVRHPREERTVRPFVLENNAVATSGDYRQYVGSYDKSHILGATDLASVTITAPTLAEADAVATAVFVSGSAGARRLLARLPHAKALLITKEGREIALNGFRELELGTQMKGSVEAKIIIANHTS